MKSRKIRMASLMLAGVMTLGLFAGCSKDASQSSTSGGNKDSIVIATMSEPPSLSPTGHSSVAGDYMNLLTYSTLFRLDMEMNPQPHLVEEYEAVNDTLWRFKLREGVQFHDGTTLTARDVVRHELVQKIVTAYAKYEEQKQKSREGKEKNRRNFKK